MPKDFPGAFAALRGILSRQGKGLTVQTDTPNEYTLVTQAIGPNKKPIWFGCVTSKKSAVTYHLMPLYYNPKLLSAIDPDLRPRMQGKTCFNFQRPDAELFSKLEDLTRMGREHWERSGFFEAGPIPPDRLEKALRAGGANPEAIARKRQARRKVAAAKRSGARKATQGGAPKRKTAARKTARPAAAKRASTRAGAKGTRRASRAR